MPAAVRHDPHPSFRFTVEIDGLASTMFAEVEGLELEVEVIEYREGGEPTTVRKVPGLTKFPVLTLRRGFTGDRELWDWIHAVAGGQLDRRNGAIILLDHAGQTVARWQFRSAFPRKWYGPTLSAESNEVVMETIELVHEGIELVSA
jgi:phage tail-like protein